MYPGSRRNHIEYEKEGEAILKCNDKYMLLRHRDHYSCIFEVLMPHL